MPANYIAALQITNNYKKDKHPLKPRAMASATSEKPIRKTPAMLADDFATWWNGITWTWSPVSG
jgi:hypothetical protein